MKSVRRFYIGAGIFLMMSFLTAVACILIPIDRRIEGGLFRPRNTAVFRINHVPYKTQTITYYDKKGNVLQIDYVGGPKTPLHTAYSTPAQEAEDRIGLSILYTTAPDGSLRRSEDFDYIRGDGKAGHAHYIYRENGTLLCKNKILAEKVEGEILWEEAYIRYTYYDESGKRIESKETDFDESLPENRELVQKLFDPPHPTYSPYPEMKKLALYHAFPFM